MVDHVGQICVNVTYSSDLGDTSSAAYSDLKNEVMGDAYPYASCTIHSFVTLAIDSAAEVSRVTHFVSFFSFLLKN